MHSGLASPVHHGSQSYMPRTSSTWSHVSWYIATTRPTSPLLWRANRAASSFIGASLRRNSLEMITTPAQRQGGRGQLSVSSGSHARTTPRATTCVGGCERMFHRILGLVSRFQAPLVHEHPESRMLVLQLLAQVAHEAHLLLPRMAHKQVVPWALP
jgi:hypothetical protein